MDFLALVLTALALSIDAFCVATTKGLASKDFKYHKAIIVGLYFGFFQAFMPLIGYFLGLQFEDFITNFDHWVALILLTIIGGKMILSSFSKEASFYNNSVAFKVMIPLAIATSIDALAAGISFAFMDINIWIWIITIGIFTFVLSFIAVKIGNIVGCKFKNKATLLGGIILIILGVKIVIEHVFM